MHPLDPGRWTLKTHIPVCLLIPSMHCSQSEVQPFQCYINSSPHPEGHLPSCCSLLFSSAMSPQALSCSSWPARTGIFLFTSFPFPHISCWENAVYLLKSTSNVAFSHKPCLTSPPTGKIDHFFLSAPQPFFYTSLTILLFFNSPTIIFSKFLYYLVL